MIVGVLLALEISSCGIVFVVGVCVVTVSVINNKLKYYTRTDTT